MKKQITQILDDFQFDEALRFFRKAKPNSIWCDELEKQKDKGYATKKLKELLKRLLDEVKENDTETIHFQPPKKILQYKKKVNDCYAEYRLAFAKIKKSESDVERKELAFTILNALAQIQEYSNIINYWNRTGKVVTQEAEIIDIRPKAKIFKEKPLPTTELGLFKVKKNILSYISRATERKTPKEKVEYWTKRIEQIDQTLKEYAV